MLHRQIYAAIRAYILDGRIGPDTCLPSTRSLAQHLSVSRNTVVAAYDQLLAEGYVEARSGSRTWVAPLLCRPAQERAVMPSPEVHLSRRGTLMASLSQPQRTPGAISLYPGVPETATFPFSIWSRLLARNARRDDDQVVGLHAFAGHPLLRQAIAGYLGISRGIDCAAEQVIVVTGAQAALDLVSRIVLDEGEWAWMEEPGYRGARSALLASGACLAPLRVRRHGWDLDDASLPPPRLIYVTPSCQWPFGTVMRMEDRLRLIGLAERHKSWIVEDDYDGEYRFRGSPVPALRGLDGTDRVIYVGTFGKTLFPALRLGFLVVPAGLADPVNRAISVSGQFAPPILQVTLADFIREGHFATHLKRMRRLYAFRQEYFVAAARRHLGAWLSVEPNDAGMQVFGKFVPPLDDLEVAAAALRHGVDVQPASINYHHDTPEHGLLLGYASLDEATTMRAIGALRTAFEELTES